MLIITDKHSQHSGTRWVNYICSFKKLSHPATIITANTDKWRCHLQTVSYNCNLVFNAYSVTKLNWWHLSQQLYLDSHPHCPKSDLNVISLNYYYTRLTALYPGLPMWAANQSGFTGARDSEWKWHQLDHMQICTSPQITMPAPHHSAFLWTRCPSCHPTNSVKVLKDCNFSKHGPST